MTNEEKYKSELDSCYDYCKLSHFIFDKENREGFCNMTCKECHEMCLEWLHNESILRDYEKEYLTNLIRPFRKAVQYIDKVEYDDYCVLRVWYKDDIEEFFDSVNIPLLNKEHFKELEHLKQYTKEDLDI